MSIFVSRSLDYAMRGLIHLGSASTEVPVSLRELSQAAYVPRQYLAKVMRSLVRGGLIESDAGAHGGYRLTRSPQEISLKEIYETLEGSFRTVVCGDGEERCELKEGCSQVPVWVALEDEILEMLERRKLADFIQDTADDAPGGGFVPVEQVEPEPAEPMTN